MPAYVSYVVFIIVYIALIFIKLYVIRGLLDFPIRKYYAEVFARILPVSLLSLVIPSMFFFCMPSSLLRMAYIILFGAISIVFIVYCVGLEKSEKELVMVKIQKIIRKNKE